MTSLFGILGGAIGRQNTSIMKHLSDIFQLF